ncbi:DUF4232 domain-containing protein [Candidatus Protofrankia californiensis]|uniref:DUF4232 domain-containing protein n=1 Tax=Candidatus Protofrankia californiensis TaxID=1839754 RepID=UPI0013EE35AE|nr:DUF4232 domain-containing protein [Candidatus Protofrankia californiensis]
MANRSRTRTTRIVATGVGLLFLAGAAACGSSDETPAPVASSKVAAPLGAEAGTRAQTGSDGGSSPRPPAGPGGQLTPAPGSPPVCTEAGLRLAAGASAGNASADRQGFVVVLTNISDKPCSMIGYPSVVATDSNGRQERPAARSEGGNLFRVGPPETVVLQPQGAASFGVEWTAVRSGDESACLPYAKFVIVPPHQARGQEVERQTTICDAFQVHPVVAATAGARPR